MNPSLKRKSVFLSFMLLICSLICVESRGYAYEPYKLEATILTAEYPQKILFEGYTNSIWVNTREVASLQKFNPATNALIGDYEVEWNPSSFHAVHMTFDDYTNSIWVTMTRQLPNSNDYQTGLVKVNPITGQKLSTTVFDGLGYSPVFNEANNTIWVRVLHLNVEPYPGGPHQALYQIQEFRVSDGAYVKTLPTTAILEFSSSSYTWNCIPVSAGENYMVYDPSTNSIWVSNWCPNNTVMKFRASDGVLLGTISGFDDSILYDDHTQSIWIAGQDGGLKKIRPSDMSIIGDYPLAGRLRKYDPVNNVIWSRGGAFFYKYRVTDGRLMGSGYISGPCSQKGFEYDPVSNSFWISCIWEGYVQKYSAETLNPPQISLTLAPGQTELKKVSFEGAVTDEARDVSEVLYKVDGTASDPSGWISIPRCKGNFNSHSALFSVVTPEMNPGSHAIHFKATNVEGIASEPISHYFAITTTPENGTKEPIAVKYDDAPLQIYKGGSYNDPDPEENLHLFRKSGSIQEIPIDNLDKSNNFAKTKVDNYEDEYILLYKSQACMVAGN